MVGLGVDSSVMSGIDVEEEDGDPNGGNSRELLYYDN